MRRHHCPNTGLAKTQAEEQQHKLRSELEAKRQAKLVKNQPEPQKPTAPLMWTQSNAIGRSTYAQDYLYTPTFHQQYIERAITNTAVDEDSDAATKLASDVNQYGGDAGLFHRAIAEVR